MKTTLLRSSALIALALPAVAHAQSTGTVNFEEKEIVVTGSATAQGVEGVQVPDTSKAKEVLTQEQLAHNAAGQTVLDSINIIPGVTFTNNDAYGTSGGQLSIRGFSADRISLTFDGVPLNDSGNYAIYSNQQLDPELIEQVNVNLGTTDVDSPTAAATGSTVNYRTRLPAKDFGVRAVGSVGEDNFWRVFGMVDTGEFTSIGTRAFVAASHSQYDNPYNNYGKLNKEQYNARIYQPIGENGDFISIAGHYNVNRNNFFGSLPLRTDLTQSATNSAPRIVGGQSGNRFPLDNDERHYDINFPCTMAVGTPGVADKVAPAPAAPTAGGSCGTEFDRRYNPSKTGNIRGSSRFTLADSVTLTVDPSYQYVKANGGGTVTAREGTFNAGGKQITGFIGGSPYFGRDVNGDGDALDQVTVLAPSETNTRRIGVITNLIWDIDSNNTVRVAYTYDRARHRQTGEVGLLDANGEPLHVFPEVDPESDVNGRVLQKRDRLSYAILHQISGEYRGRFFDDALSVTAGIRAPFFTRNLNNYCATSSASGFVECFTDDAAAQAAWLAANPTQTVPGIGTYPTQGPQHRELKYDKVLPNVGLVYHITQPISVFANYSKGLQVPGTDALYNAFYFPFDTEQARPKPETTDNFDAGLRYRSSKVQAQLVGWYTKYTNRLASAYDPELERNVYRNLGAVDKYGVDASIAYQPIPQFALYAFGSYMKSKIKDNVQSGTCSSANVTANVPGCTVAGDPLFVATAGNREGGAPAYTYGAQARGFFGPVEVGITGKRTGGRYIYDSNLPVYGGTAAAPYVIYPAKTNAYWLVNLDARLNLEFIGLNDKTYLQLNVYNLFDKLYVGNYTTGLNQGNVLGAGVFTGNPGSPVFAQIGAPRTISASLNVGF
uniref:TonB-dependent receptor n=1 Tax=Altererythrobacter segetis TaxID=1104773 RepID=UPI00140B1710|nr:TonB-dependent receptor [Altererythrobacter segetis]